MNEATTTLIQTLPQIITSLAALVGAVGGVWIGILGYRKSKDNAKAIEGIHEAVNGQTAKLVAVEKATSRAEGVTEGIQQQKETDSR